MPTRKSGQPSIQGLYTAGIQEVNHIIASGNKSQRNTALQTLDDLTAMMLAHTLETVQGRTALLTGLISELTQIIEAIQTAPPFLEAIDAVTGIIQGARARLAVEKKNLLPAEG